MSAPSRDTGALLRSFAPPLFVLIWSTGFIVARLVKPYTEPLTFLCVRYVLSACVFAGAAGIARAPWPRGFRAWRDAAISGLLIQAAYLGSVFWAVRHGLPAGIAALIVGLQPLLTAALAGPLLHEVVDRRRWIGIGTGFAGAVLVLAPKLGMTSGIPLLPAAISVSGMAAITLGTIWQKRTAAGADLRTNLTVQFLAALAVTAPLAYFTESGHIDPTPALLAGLLWSVFGLSLGAVSLLLMLIRRGAVAGVAALLYLVPPVAATMAFLLFGERLTPLQIGGMALAALGVAIASRQTTR